AHAPSPSPAENARRQEGRVLPFRFKTQQAAADDPATEVRVDVAVHGRVRDGGDAFGDFRGGKRVAGAVAHDVEVKDNAPAGKGGHFLQEVVHRQARPVNQLQFPLV